MINSDFRFRVNDGIDFIAGSPEGYELLRSCLAAPQEEDWEPAHAECPGFLTPEQARLEVDAELGTAFDMTQALYCGFGEDPEAQATRGRVAYHMPTEQVVWDDSLADGYNIFLFR